MLDPAIAYEAGEAAGLIPAYLRGLAFLASGGHRARTEFEKAIVWRGIALSSTIGALAHPQLARAYALEGQQASAKAAYQDFLSSWKAADPGVPVIKAAQSDAAKL
jgi:hypothetical protein